MAWACSPSCEGEKILLHNYCQRQTNPLTFTKDEWGNLKANAKEYIEHKVHRLRKQVTQLHQGRQLIMQKQRYYHQDTIKMLTELERLGVSVNRASNSWFRLKSWTETPEIESRSRGSTLSGESASLWPPPPPTPTHPCMHVLSLPLSLPLALSKVNK